MTSLNCFVRQEATPQILQNVSRYCAECYKEFSENEPLFYDMQHYRYLCSRCAERMAEQLDELCEVVEEPESPSLF
ncbi:hypothetical protein [Nitratifractor salsuginis]|uniref:Uncharacterized protein n=1 Tax=Nitratifractor salsuginis (strain DSM 16511 / JCM 12458 / E9I37-1) TaxID=749222 RepID=E6X2L9_NITSE|nr:hypothetical protein [Nitratifractor salsuginis]ADV46085.1 hypothetical protein Nitsa_0823 [Nitratifractor salsuginis DSM 16511]